MPPRPAAAFVQSLLLGALTGVVCGLGSAAFLALLDVATDFRTGHTAIVWALPLAGLLLGGALAAFGGPVAGGTGLVLDRIREPGPPVPRRMAPIVLLGSVWTHLFGGSAGREGAAVQIGASLTDTISARLRLHHRARRHVLAAAIAGGFGSVFGTPAAGAVFALEVLALGRLETGAIVPAVVAAFVGDLTTRATGITHSDYPLCESLGISLPVIGKWLVFAAAIAAITVLFVEGTHRLKTFAAARIPSAPLRLACGGVAVVLAWRLSGTDDYLGLGVPTILRAFTDPALPETAFAWKLGMTILTLGAGFLGGEVTPLFFVGACAGNALAQALGLPLGLGAAVGMAATFGAAAKTPIALTVMAVELTGAAVMPHALIVCGAASFLTGRRSIYRRAKPAE